MIRDFKETLQKYEAQIIKSITLLLKKSDVNSDMNKSTLKLVTVRNKRYIGLDP